MDDMANPEPLPGDNISTCSENTFNNNSGISDEDLLIKYNNLNLKDITNFTESRQIDKLTLLEDILLFDTSSKFFVNYAIHEELIPLLVKCATDGSRDIAVCATRCLHYLTMGDLVQLDLMKKANIISESAKLLSLQYDNCRCHVLKVLGNFADYPEWSSNVLETGLTKRLEAIIDEKSSKKFMKWSSNLIYYICRNTEVYHEMIHFTEILGIIYYQIDYSNKEVRTNALQAITKLIEHDIDNDALIEHEIFDKVIHSLDEEDSEIIEVVLGLFETLIWNCYQSANRIVDYSNLVTQINRIITNNQINLTEKSLWVLCALCTLPSQIQTIINVGLIDKSIELAMNNTFLCKDVAKILNNLSSFGNREQIEPYIGRKGKSFFIKIFKDGDYDKTSLMGFDTIQNFYYRFEPSIRLILGIERRKIGVELKIANQGIKPVNYENEDKTFLNLLPAEIWVEIIKKIESEELDLLKYRLVSKTWDRLIKSLYLKKEVIELVGNNTENMLDYKDLALTLRHHPGINTLVVRDQDIDEENFVQCLREFSLLRVMIISKCKGLGWKFIVRIVANYPALQFLQISGFEIEEKMLELMCTGLQLLNTLAIYGNHPELTGKSFDKLGRYIRDLRIEFAHGVNVNHALSCLSTGNGVKLTKLVLRVYNFQEINWDIMVNFLNLECLEIGFLGNGTGNFKGFKHLKKLKKLALSEWSSNELISVTNDVNIVDLFSNLEKIEHLYFGCLDESSNRLTTLTIQTIIEKFPNLKSFGLRNSRYIKNQNIMTLTKLRHLESIKLFKLENISTSGVICLFKRNDSIRSVHLSECPNVSPRGLEEFIKKCWQNQNVVYILSTDVTDLTDIPPNLKIFTI